MTEDLTARLRSVVASVQERHGRPLSRYIRFGFPLPKGQHFDHRALVVADDAGQWIPHSLLVTARWPDNSIQWLLVRCWIDIAANESVSLLLQRNRDVSRPVQEVDIRTITVTEHETTLQVDAAGQSFAINTDQTSFETQNETVTMAVRASGEEFIGTIENIDYSRIEDKTDSIAVEMTVRGHFKLANNRRLNFRHEVTVSDEGRHLGGRVMLHNPAAARHVGGTWDLGDPNSIMIERFALDVTSAGDGFAGGTIVLEEDDSPTVWSESMSITQCASGGAHWNSPVHVDLNNRVPLSESGYVLEIDGQEQRGNRPNPVITLNSQRQVHLRLAEFWQRFPNRIVVTADTLNVELLPLSTDAHELQPGERYTRSYEMRFDDSAESLHATPQITLNAEHLRACRIPEIGEPSAIDPRLMAIVNEGLSGENSFFAKREAIDEYGWRHFGELYADHETDGYDGKHLFVSHYNNQYDPLGGLLRQYLMTGQAGWMELADGLARHCVDIDIYHTLEDRPEYNGGLFWHTDHYVPAATATHRSYSRQQPLDAYDGHVRGGGPGGQHCYTTGLLLHYLLTGDEDSRDAVYGLRRWIQAVYEGSGTLVDVALVVKNRHRPDLKDHLTGRYPLDRGVANYLHALLDCLALDQAPSTMAQAEWVIRNTIHPADNIDSRNLEDIEEHWFYVVFLQAVARYLRVKASFGSPDEHFVHARDALLHYADWMVANEAPYLDTPERLEFPNHTWTAQDLRKANVLFEAAFWSRDATDQYQAKAQEFVDYVATTLQNEPTRQYTRILSLLMLNLNPTTAPVDGADHRFTQLRPASRYVPPTGPGTVAQLGNLLRLTGQALWPLRPTREIAALRSLLPRGISESNDG